MKYALLILTVFSCYSSSFAGEAPTQADQKVSQKQESRDPANAVAQKSEEGQQSVSAIANEKSFERYRMNRSMPKN